MSRTVLALTTHVTPSCAVWVSCRLPLRSRSPNARTKSRLYHIDCARQMVFGGRENQIDVAEVCTTNARNGGGKIDFGVSYRREQRSIAPPATRPLDWGYQRAQAAVMGMRQKPQSPRLFGVLNYEMSSQDTSTEVIARLRETANVHRERNVLRD